MPYLVIEGPNGEMQRVQIDQEAVTIGRDGSCEVTIEDRLVSRRHVSIAAGFIVEDLESFNGVYVRGKRIQRAFLMPGEGFRIGAKGTFSVTVMADAPPSQAAVLQDLGSTLDEGSLSSPPRAALPPAAAQTPPAGPQTHILDSKEFEDRLHALSREMERLALENRELRHRLADPRPGAPGPSRPGQAPPMGSPPADPSPGPMPTMPDAPEFRSRPAHPPEGPREER